MTTASSVDGTTVPSPVDASPPRPYSVERLVAAAGFDSISGAGQAAWARDLYRLRKQGGMTEQQADKWACRFGLHPGDIWPELYWAADTAAEVSSDDVEVAEGGGARCRRRRGPGRSRRAGPGAQSASGTRRQPVTVGSTGGGGR